MDTLGLAIGSRCKVLDVCSLVLTGSYSSMVSSLGVLTRLPTCSYSAATLLFIIERSVLLKLVSSREMSS